MLARRRRRPADLRTRHADAASRASRPARRRGRRRHPPERSCCTRPATAAARHRAQGRLPRRQRRVHARHAIGELFAVRSTSRIRARSDRASASRSRATASSSFLRSASRPATDRSTAGPQSRSIPRRPSDAVTSTAALPTSLATRDSSCCSGPMRSIALSIDVFSSSTTKTATTLPTSSTRSTVHRQRSATGRRRDRQHLETARGMPPCVAQTRERVEQRFPQAPHRPPPPRRVRGHCDIPRPRRCSVTAACRTPAPSRSQPRPIMSPISLWLVR